MAEHFSNQQFHKGVHIVKRLVQLAIVVYLLSLYTVAFARTISRENDKHFCGEGKIVAKVPYEEHPGVFVYVCNNGEHFGPLPQDLGEV